MTKKVMLILILLLFMFQAAIVNAADEPDKKTLKKIVKLMKKGDAKAKKNEFDKALEYYNKVLALSTEYAPVYFGIAILNVQQKKFDNAIENLEKAIKIKSDFAPAILLLAQNLLAMGNNMISQRQPEKSNEYLLKVLDIPGIKDAAGDQLLQALYQLGINYYQLRKPDKSNECLLKVLESPGLETSDNKTYINATYQLGLNYFALKKYEEVEKYLSKLLKIENLKTEFLRVYSMSLYMMGVNSNQLKQYEKSTAHLLEYLELTQANPSDQFAPIANYLIGSNNFDLLEKEINPIKNNKKEKEPRTKIAKIAKENKNVQPFLSKAIELNPNLEPAYMLLGNYYYYCKDYENATKNYQILVTKFPKSPDIVTYKNFMEALKRESKL